MFEALIGVVAGAVVAFFCMQFYRQGVKDGRAIEKKEDPKPIRNKAEKARKKEPKKEEKAGRIASYLFSEGDRAC